VLAGPAPGSARGEAPSPGASAGASRGPGVSRELTGPKEGWCDNPRSQAGIYRAVERGQPDPSTHPSAEKIPLDIFLQFSSAQPWTTRQLFLQTLWLARSSAAPRRAAGQTTAQQCLSPSDVLGLCLTNKTRSLWWGKPSHKQV